MNRTRLIVLAVLVSLVLVLIPAEAADDGVYLDFYPLSVGDPVGACDYLSPGSNPLTIGIIYDLPVDITWDAAIVAPPGPVTGSSSGALSAGTVLSPAYDTFGIDFVNSGGQVDPPWEFTVQLNGYAGGVLTSQATALIGCAYVGIGGFYQTPLTFDPLATTPPAEEPAAEPAPGCDVLITIPDTAVGATITADTPVYWVPGEMSTETFPAGLTLRALGVDASGAYTKVLYACGYYWVPSSAIGPNYDEVWNGTPLPTDVVE